MDREEIKKEIAERISGESNSTDVSEDIATAIINEQNSGFNDKKTDDKVAVEDIKTEEKEQEIDNKQKYGKFKNPEELLRAYGELEKEFTRRSQRLKELESGQAKTEMSEEDWKRTVDKFFEQTPSARIFAKEIAQKLIDEPSLKQDANCLNIALNQVLIDKFKTPEQLMSDGQFLQDYVFSSDAVKNAIVSKYLSDVRAGQPPVTLSDEGLGAIAPNRKPKSIEEAGFMFLKNNK